jgi:hypothetical protein
VDSILKKRVVKLNSRVACLSAGRIETAGSQGAVPCHNRATNTGDSFSLLASFFEKQNHNQLIISSQMRIDPLVELN